MKKIIKILIFCIIFLSCTVFYIWREFSAQKILIENKTLNNNISQCAFPNKQGLNLYCHEDNEWVLCNDKKILKCGDEIRIMIKIDGNNVKNPFIMCLRQGFDLSVPIDNHSVWTILDEDSIFTCWTDDNSGDEILSPLDNLGIDIMLNGIVKKNNDSIELLKVFAFPVKNYQSIQELITDQNNAEIILNLDKEIICE